MNLSESNAIISKGTIVYIGGFELPDKNAAAHRVLTIGKIIRELGYKVVFISINKKIQNNVLQKRVDIQGFETWFFPYPATKRHWIDYLSNIKMFTEVLNNHPDVRAVICYNYPSLALIKIRNLCRKRNIKIIADCTEWYGSKGTNVIYKSLKGLDTILRMRIIHKRLDGLIVISGYLENYYGKCKNLIRIPPLVDLSEEKWKKDVSEIDDEIIRFVYAGNPGKDKDKLNLLIETLYALRTYNNYLFYIVGITQKQYLIDHEDHKKMLEELGTRVVFLGHLSHIESLKYVKAADFSVFIRDDTRETRAGFPTKFVESISCGIPVITTPTSDLPNYVEEGKNGYFLAFENEKVKKQLIKILSTDRKSVLKMKKYCSENNPFYYMQYLNIMRIFLDKLN